MPTSGGIVAELGRATNIARKSVKIMSGLLEQARLGEVVETADLVPLVNEIAASVARDRSALSSVLRPMSKDEHNATHAVAVAALMINLARELGFEEAQVREAGIAGLLHDVGKMAVPLAILNKPGPLTEAEDALMRTHPERGHALLFRSGTVPDAALDVCLHHHEKMDGSGYPFGLRGEDMSLLARMGAICDVYDAVTSHRPYKAPWDAADAIEKMASWKGHFDDGLFEAFIRTVGIYPVGTLLRLQSDRLAIVTGVTRENPARPLVRVIMSARDGQLLRPEDIDLADEADSVVSTENPREWGFDDWERQWCSLARAAKSRLPALSLSAGK